MRFTKNQLGFAVIETFLIVVVLAIVGFTGWFVYHSKQTADKNYKGTSNTQTPPPATVKTFAECEKATGSKILTTYPEQCLTKDGKSFTNIGQSQKYLVIKEWGVKIRLSSADSGAYYAVPTDVQKDSGGAPESINVYTSQSDSLVGPAGVSCKGEYVAYLLRLPRNDPKWQPSTNVDDGNVSPLYGERMAVGSYQYAIATKKEYGPSCFETSKSGNYVPDAATTQKFSDVVSTFAADFKTIKTE